MAQQTGAGSVMLLDNDEYRRLDAQHHEYEERLADLTAKVVLSEDEQLEETTLKKKKLQVKDRMQAIAREHAVQP
jgi:uncharacterized protein YdcH (DUF465 family)